MGDCFSGIDQEEQKRIQEQQRIQRSELLAVQLDAGQPPPLQLQIRELETVGALRRKAAEMLALPDDALQLIFAESALLEMWATVESVGIREDAVLNVEGVEGERIEEVREKVQKAMHEASTIDVDQASRQGDLAKIRMVLDYAPGRTDERNYVSFTPLHTAAAHDHHSVAELLLQHKANVNAKTDEHRADVNAKDEVRLCYKRARYGAELVVRVAWPYSAAHVFK